MNGPRRLAAVVLVVGWVATAPSPAEVQKLASDGSVYRVDLVPWVQAGKPNGTVLRMTRQKPNGGKETFNIAGTDDAVVERDPSLEIDPSSGRPLVVWARNDGPGFNLYVSRYDGTWSTPQLLARLDGDDLEP